MNDLFSEFLEFIKTLPKEDQLNCKRAFKKFLEIKKQGVKMKNKMKHTPGPWIADHFDRVDSKHGQICVLNKGQETCAANAYLIAAAPSLLEECRRSLDTIDLMIAHIESGEPNAQSMADDLKTEMNGLRIAIAKAEGIL